MDKIKKNILKSLRNTYCRLMPSKIQGVGVFAIRDMPKGKNPFYGTNKESWIKFTKEELMDLDREILDMINVFFVVNKNNTVHIPDFGINRMDISYFVNHSKKPNLTTNKNGVNFVTSRKIKKGEELTVSYSTYAHDEKYRI